MWSNSPTYILDLIRQKNPWSYSPTYILDKSFVSPLYILWNSFINNARWIICSLHKVILFTMQSNFVHYAKYFFSLRQVFFSLRQVFRHICKLRECSHPFVLNPGLFFKLELANSAYISFFNLQSPVQPDSTGDSFLKMFDIAKMILQNRLQVSIFTC
jgi:hypothetical protein